MISHTPGPLNVQRYHGGYFVTAPSPDSDSQHRVTIAQFPDAQLGAMHSHQAGGNAHLFVVAADLLAALRTIRDVTSPGLAAASIYYDMEPRDRIADIYAKARTAVAKAERAA